MAAVSPPVAGGEAPTAAAALLGGPAAAAAAGVAAGPPQGLRRRGAPRRQSGLRAALQRFLRVAPFKAASTGDRNLPAWLPVLNLTAVAAPLSA